ncbi:shugoshin family protein [Aspergillus aculeatinus CBS 121060]|uniref:Uncharacterized protein n=1 Tax=Aspergillus aculeatinus CBS 121060 TaxID=1448322 RepID=A0ACD1GR57_9EURO|nr:hypothetical protein BO66DRAFT_396706 [Aspergillus aculeatinus CBS 121060]RAH63799.1 hypothetical protein BO66DRAFT_396706 [Aspergillus aculeatinus CBS 121060]
MARLNESTTTTTTESIEGLKRRFVRQNREIARVNSIQSLRIRSLESEVSHLLAENVSLREEAITLNQELERYQAVKILQDGVYDIKSRLDAKLTELTNLVTELGELPRDYRKKHNTAQIRSPTQPSQSALNWARKTAEMEQNFACEEEGKLPAILEDKYFPRKTLDPHEIQGVLDSDAIDHQSPATRALATMDTDFSIPPNEESTINRSLESWMDPNHADVLLPLTKDHVKEERELDATISENNPAAYEAAPMRKNPISGPSLGAKRKFSADIEDRFESPLNEDDDFEYRQTRSPLGAVDPIDPTSGRSPFKEDNHPLNESNKNVKQARRRILKQKSTNVSIPSPRKAFDSMLDDAHFSREDDVIAAIGDKGNGSGLVEATSYTQNKGETLGRALTHHTSKAEARNVGMAYEARSLGSLTQIDRLEQPKSGADIRDAVVGGATGSSRPTRRQRAIVSYAEPNLRDKMRRPTNELVAAVGDRTRRTSSTIDIPMSTGEDGDAYRRRKSDTVKSQVLGTTGTDSPSPVLNSAMASPSKSMKMVSQRKRKLSLASRYDHATTRETAEGSSERSDYPLTDLGIQEHEPEGQYTAALSIKNSSDEGLSTRFTEAPCDSMAKTISRAHKPQPATARQSKRRLSSLKASEQDTLKPDEAVQDSRDITPSLFKVSPIKVNERLEQPDYDRRASAEIFQISSTTSVSAETKQGGRSLRAAARRSTML